MPDRLVPWHIQPTVQSPDWLLQMVRERLAITDHPIPDPIGIRTAQLLWQRGIQNPQQVQGFLNPDQYEPTSPFALGQEMHRAVTRLLQARDQREPIAIWGDVDADGIAATAVLWEGLQPFFEPDALIYTIPDRLTDLHGLSCTGIDQLAQQGCQLIITADTGSLNLAEITYARDRGIDLILIDHHRLAMDRPPVSAILNPGTLPPDHPLACLSGVAIAYKLVEAFDETLPDVSPRSLETLLDLVAIGLIADPVELVGDCRYLAQRGIERLQQQTHPRSVTRPGIARLLQLCQRSGDRPMDPMSGLGPRIHAISQIQSDASLGVELLTNRDPKRGIHLAEDTELANSRRKALQKDLLWDVRQKLAQLDLATTGAIVLADPQWPIEMLSLAAAQIAQEYNRPTFLLHTEPEEDASNQPDAERFRLARGAARSVPAIDLYPLLQAHAPLLHRFGGHPLAVDLSLPVANLPLFTAAINQKLRQQGFPSDAGAITADLTVTVAELGHPLFRELKLLEPYGLGNPTPRLLIQNCWFMQVKHRNIQDWKGGPVRYIKTEFDLWDESVAQGFPGVWWEHYRDEVPMQRCDAIVELDFNAKQKRYEVRLIALRPSGDDVPVYQPIADWIVDWRNPEQRSSIHEANVDPILVMRRCPSNWGELQRWFRRARQEQKLLAIAYPPPPAIPPEQIWQQLVGLAKYLSRTRQRVTRRQLYEKLGLSDRTLQQGFQILQALGFQVQSVEGAFQITWPEPPRTNTDRSPLSAQLEHWFAVIQEERFRQQYFYQVPLTLIQVMASRL